MLERITEESIFALCIPNEGPVHVCRVLVELFLRGPCFGIVGVVDGDQRGWHVIRIPKVIHEDGVLDVHPWHGGAIGMVIVPEGK